MTRHKDADWTLPPKMENWTQVQVAVLMDIRDELKRMNSILHCHNTIAIPSILRRISANTANLPKAKKAPKP